MFLSGLRLGVDIELLYDYVCTVKDSNYMIEVTVQVALEQDDALKTRNTVLIYLVLPVAVWISY